MATMTQQFPSAGQSNGCGSTVYCYCVMVQHALSDS